MEIKLVLSVVRGPLVTVATVAALVGYSNGLAPGSRCTLADGGSNSYGNSNVDPCPIPM